MRIEVLTEADTVARKAATMIGADVRQSIAAPQSFHHDCQSRIHPMGNASGSCRRRRAAGKRAHISGR
jgi:hypothetical protein